MGNDEEPKQVDAMGRATDWTLDGNGRNTARQLPDGTRETSSYDNEGNRLTKSTFGGETFSYQYGSANRLAGQVSPAGSGGNSAIAATSAVLRYTPGGQLASVQEQGATTLGGIESYQWDANDRLTQVSNPIGRINYGLDAAGNVVEQSVAGAGTVRSEFDAAGRLDKVIAADGKQTAYFHDAVGRISRVERQINDKDGQPQVLVTYNRYDSASRLIAVVETKRTGATEALMAGQAIIRGTGGTINRIETYRVGSTFDGASGQFGGAPARTQAFEYDLDARLARELVTKGAASTDTRYQYDLVGNRTTKTVTTAAGVEITSYTYDVADRLTSESVSLAAGGTSGTAYTYDANGNLASKTEAGKVTLYRFDPQNRLIDLRTGATLAEAQAATPGVSYAYEFQGNRIRKTTAQGATGYLIDSTQTYAQVVRETRGGQSIDYVRGAQLIRQNGSGGQALYPLHGHLGTSLGAVDADGNLVEEVDADAFGNFDQATGLKQTHLYTGEFWDESSQLLYLRARWYDPKLGRFISADPFEGKQSDPRSLNRYAYAAANPVHNTDPGGEMTLGEVGTTLNTISTLASNAIDVVNILRGDPDSERMDGPPGLWDYLMAFTVRGLAASVPSSLDGGLDSDFRNFMGPIKGERHHTIPVYTCGHETQRKATLLQKDHKILHNRLNNYKFYINIGGITIDLLVYKKPTSRIIKTPLQRLGKTSMGRAAIAAGLAFFYAQGGWLTKGRPTVGVTLALETPRFIGSHHSAPSCQR